jgi:gamma-glutamyltranspeptidase/glutathione hydrolase
MEVFQCPPNGSGLIVLMILGMIEKLGTVEQGFLSAERAHLHIEAARLAYRDRDAFLADPAQVEVPVGRLTSDAYLDQLAKLIAAETAMPELPPAGTADWARHKDTVYLSVVDRDGNACSFINSLFESFGSGILAEKSGVMLQNRGYGFRLQDGHPNCIAPDKRPMHTIIPGMVMKDGQAIMPYGVMGGHFQPMGQSWFLANHFEYGLDVQEALDARHPSVGRRPPEPHGPCLRADREAAWRRPGDPDRPGARLPDRRVRPAQGWLCAGLLSVRHERTRR